MMLVLFCFCMTTFVTVEANFDFTVRFYEYWNPTGLCAECGTNGVPVCCDDPQHTESCNNTGVLRCDTRFRFIQRPFSASLETAPSGDFPSFTQGITNENHDTFTEGPGGFLSLPNPHISTNTSKWTGRIQFLIDAFDRINNNKAPNETKGIVDRFIVNLDQLQLGADLTERRNYTGVYNISQLAMSFRVECSENYYDSDCTTFCEAVEGVYTCNSDGNTVCVEENRDPTTRCANCSENYYGSDCTTFCEAIEGEYNCDSNGNIVCMEENRDPTTRCAGCSKNYYRSDCSTICEAVEELYDCDSEGNIICTQENRDPLKNCTSGSDDSVMFALIGGVCGGMVGLILISITIAIVCCVVYKTKRPREKKHTSATSCNPTTPLEQLQVSSSEDSRNVSLMINSMYSTLSATPDTTQIQASSVPEHVDLSNPLYDEAQLPGNIIQNANKGATVNPKAREYEVAMSQNNPKYETTEIRSHGTGVFDDPEYGPTETQQRSDDVDVTHSSSVHLQHGLSVKSSRDTNTMHIENPGYETVARGLQAPGQPNNVFDDPEYDSTDGFPKLQDGVPKSKTSTMNAPLTSKPPPGQAHIKTSPTTTGPQSADHFLYSDAHSRQMPMSAPPIRQDAEHLAQKELNMYDTVDMHGSKAPDDQKPSSNEYADVHAYAVTSHIPGLMGHRH